MVQVDLPAAFTVGHLFAWLSKNYLKGEPKIFSNRLLGPLNLYLSCGFSVVGLFLLIGWPAWEVMYVSAWAENPFNRPLAAGFYILFVIAMVVLGNAGFILGHHWCRKGKEKRVVIGTITGAVLTVLPFLLRWGVWWDIGTYAEVEAGQAASFWQPPFFYGWLAVMSYFLIITILTGVWFKKQGSTAPWSAGPS